MVDKVPVTAEGYDALNEELKEIASLGMEGRDPAILPRIDGLLDTFEGEMRAIASGLSVAELRSKLPLRPRVTA